MQKTKEKQRDPIRTKERILAEATRLFAKKGFDGCSANEIVKAAKINKRMLFHYFESKEGLYRATLANQWSGLRQEFEKFIGETGAGGSSGDSRNLLIKALEAFFDFLSGRPEFLRLLMWEGLAGGKTSRSLWNEVRGPIYKDIIDLMKTAQNAGIIGRELDPAHLVISFMGAVSFYFAYAETLVDIIGEKPLSAKKVEERKNQVVKLFRHAVLSG